MMTVSTQWLVEGRVLLNQFGGIITEDEISQLVREAVSRMHQFPDNTIHILSDTRAVTHYPRRIAILRRALKSIFQHEKLGYTVLISNDYFHRHLGAVFAQLFRVQWVACATYEEACHLLTQFDPALPPLPHHAEAYEVS